MKMTLNNEKNILNQPLVEGFYQEGFKLGEIPYKIFAI